MTVHSRVLDVVRLLAKVFIWFVVLGLMVPAYKLVSVLIGGVFVGWPSFVFELGDDRLPLAPDANMVEGTLLVVGRSQAFLGAVAVELDAVFTVGYPMLIAVLAVRALDLARSDGPFSEAMPTRLGRLGWALVAQPVSAAAQALCTAQLRSTVLAGSTFGDEFSSAFGDALTWAAIASGAGILVFRSIIIEGVGMRRDLDGTV
ncbi:MULTISPECIES: DUF2975 domain-containing protein [Pseudonocardia]|uniref:DUF2975 domain-containing protein n=2 Tax=Pseudonocardia TaxID=1847 RepID=A0A1Y2MM79_PSEAH|nr:MULTISPECIES: DUF2975 domain-containing protein [Pseudonocardia]OSY36363.1 hypothetical protein BG845_05440 [Pseudonocardia autotrophica]TDN72681.1 hypothetical protein C8E95_1741 [Pseudonocardia autotrophica]BBG03392.1 hypothetical protein Pdca_46010 [Pseudonocardia autotrophica]GEC27253.1 hypothetical protein PSA01_42820 [Pseudonocardia saturnea]